MSDDPNDRIVQLFPQVGGKLPPLPRPKKGSPDDPLPTPLASPASSEQVFARELDRLRVAYDYTTQAYTIPGEGELCRDLSDVALFDALVIRGGLDVPDMSHETLGRYLRMWTREKEHETVNQVRKRLDCVDRDRGQAELARWIDLVCREGHELSQVILTQWIWLVRCKLRDPDRADSHVMPVLQGDQGIGKTKAVTYLLRPLEPLWQKWDFSQIADERHHLEFARCWVGYVEELAGAKEQDLSRLKSIITSRRAYVRLFNTQRRTTIPMNTTFIGDTNKSVRDIIRDSTGGRRFWELRCRPRIDLAALERLDYGAIWGCVSEADPCPTQSSTHFDTIRHLQAEKIRYKSSVEEWLGDDGPAPGTRPATYDTLYSLYRAFCRRTGHSPTSQRRMIAELASAGFERGQVRKDGKVQKTLGIL